MFLNSWTNKFLFAWYCIFAFTALVFEPAYYYGCNWDGIHCEQAKTIPWMKYVQQIWLLYAQWDPLFYVVPMWLRVLCSIEVFIFGPLYLITAYGMWKNAQWLNFIGLPFSGALIYSTIVYFIMEAIENREGTNFWMVFLVNIPWTIIPFLFIFRALQATHAPSHGKEN